MTDKFDTALAQYLRATRNHPAPDLLEASAGHGDDWGNYRSSGRVFPKLIDEGHEASLGFDDINGFEAEV